jgi:hypothetical protein
MPPESELTWEVQMETNGGPKSDGALIWFMMDFKWNLWWFQMEFVWFMNLWNLYHAYIHCFMVSNGIYDVWGSDW